MRALFIICFVLQSGAGEIRAADIDASKLPPASGVTVQFERDIQPILERSCLRCHGPERPRSGLRLDRRDLALKGGDLGVDIIPGNSAESPLIHYVARLVPDMEMPPEGRDEPLTSDEVALLRAWIDQGAPWGDRPLMERERLLFTVKPAIRWITIDGDQRKFREHTGMTDGWAGGIQEFRYEQFLDEQGLFTAEGRSVFGERDYQLKLGWEKNDSGFVRIGFEQYRSYSDDTGGYFEPFATNAFSLGRDLHMEYGRAWIDAGLTMPDLPRLRLGYEYRYREGEKMQLAWSDVFDAAGNSAAIYPASKHIDEAIHILKFDASHEIQGLRLDDSFRAEFYDIESVSLARTPFQIGEPVSDTGTRRFDETDYFHAVNTVRLEKQVRDWWLVSGGYLFSKLDGGAAFNLEGFMPSDPSVVVFEGERSDDIVLERRSHVLNANTAVGPWQGLSLSAGVQSDWTREQGSGESLFPGFPSAFPKVHASDRDKVAVEELFGLRLTQIPFTVLYAEARFQQEHIDHFEEQFLFDDFASNDDFLRDTDATSDLQEYRAGVSISPWRRVLFQTNVKRRSRDTDYDHRRDFDLSERPGNGYPAFITARDLESEEIETKLTVHWQSWLKTSVNYQLVAIDYTTVTDPSLVTLFDPVTFMPFDVQLPGGGILAGNYDAHIYSVNATVTPWRRLFLSSTVAFSDSRTVSGVNNGETIVPYEGHIWSVISSASFVMNKSTDWTGSYSFSRADFEQNNAAAGGLPTGIAYTRHGLVTGFTRRLRENMKANLQYGFFDYGEPAFGGVNNYTAHAVFGSLLISLK